MSEETETLERIAAGDYLYLAHPRESMDCVREWELDFERRSGIVLFNPFYEIARENSDIDINEKDFRKAHKILNSSTVKKELEYIRYGRGMIAIIDGKYTIGTFMEMVYAYEIFKKSVHTFVTNEYENHPWVKEHSSKVYTDRDVMEGRLVELYGNMKKEVSHG